MDIELCFGLAHSRMDRVQAVDGNVVGDASQIDDSNIGHLPEAEFSRGSQALAITDIEDVSYARLN